MMDLFKRLVDRFGKTFNAEVTPAVERTAIEFSGGRTAITALASHLGNPNPILEALALTPPWPTIIIMGGAGNMEPESLVLTRSLIEDGLARFAEERRVALIDGGTSSGVMAMIGTARQRRGYRFPLIGVAPRSQISYPAFDNPNALAALEPNHTHFVLTDGDNFGVESEMIARLSWALSGYGQQPVLALIINGGEVVRTEAYQRATGNPRFPLLVLEGSGRLADELAAAQKKGYSEDANVSEILRKGDIHFLPVQSGAPALRNWLDNFFGL